MTTTKCRKAGIANPDARAYWKGYNTYMHCIVSLTGGMWSA